MNDREIFAEALQKPTRAERSSYLDQACGNDATKRKRIEALLAGQANLGSFMEHPPVEGALTELCSDTAKLAESLAESNPETVELDDVSLDFLEPSDQPDSLGRLAQYEITQIVGRGGMGIVLKAHDTKLNRVVAVKVLAPELAANATARKRFLREARSAAAVSHDHVVTIYAVEEGDLPFLVMEFIDGQSLQQKIDGQGQLELKEILRIGRQAAAGLAAAHEQGLIHRDVKPSNILLQNGVERVEITDFGLARAVDDANITRTGEITGTPQYMSPEQAQGHPVDARSDLFSLGSVLYAMCTGRSPFRAETTMASLRRVCDDTPRPICEVNPEIPQWLTEIIDRLLEKDPEDRFQTATEVSDLLSRHLAHVQDPLSTPLPGSIGTTSARNRQASRRHRRLFAACALLVLIGGLGLTEATGVTHVAEFVGTVLRIRTPNGTLVLEIDDPVVKVAVEGNGEVITIFGAGIEKLQLRPGQYKMRATKDGKPVRLDQELVTITRGGRQVVKVTLQRTATPQHIEIEKIPSEYTSVPQGSITEVRRYEGHDGEVNGVLFSSDGDYVISSQQKGPQSIFVWDSASARRVGTFGPGGNTGGIAVSKDGQMLASTKIRDGCTIELWNLRTREHIQTLSGHSNHLMAMAFSPDGRFLASGSMDETMRIWDLQSAKELHHCSALVPPRLAWVTDVAYSSDGRYVLASHGPAGAILWDSETGQIVRRFEGTNRFESKTGAIWTVALSPDDRLAASAGWDSDEGGKVIRLWDVSSGRQLAQLAGHTGWVRTVRFSPDGRHLASGSQDHTLRVWNVADGREVCRVEHKTHYPLYLAFSPNGRQVVSGGGWNKKGDRAVRLWQLPQSVWPETDDSTPAENPVVAPVPTTDQEPADPQ